MSLLVLKLTSDGDKKRHFSLRLLEGKLKKNRATTRKSFRILKRFPRDNNDPPIADLEVQVTHCLDMFWVWSWWLVLEKETLQGSRAGDPGRYHTALGSGIDASPNSVNSKFWPWILIGARAIIIRILQELVFLLHSWKENGWQDCTYCFLNLQTSTPWRNLPSREIITALPVCLPSFLPEGWWWWWWCIHFNKVEPD